MKILKRTTTNNGYGCSCCADYYNETMWIDEKNVKSPLQLLKKIIRTNINEDHECKLVYEYDGKILYGFDNEVGKMGESITLRVGKKQKKLFEIRDKKPKKLEELISVVKEKFPEFLEATVTTE
jgi:hypothetical protein